MTNKQMPEALRLADELDGEWTQVWHMVASAKELRRQHAEIERLREALQNAMGIIDTPIARRLFCGDFYAETIKCARAALQSTKEQQ